MARGLPGASVADPIPQRMLDNAPTADTSDVTWGRSHEIHRVAVKVNHTVDGLARRGQRLDTRNVLDPVNEYLPKRRCVPVYRSQIKIQTRPGNGRACPCGAGLAGWPASPKRT